MAAYMCMLEHDLPAIILEVVYVYVIHKHEAAMLLDLQLCFAAEVSSHCHHCQADSRVGLLQRTT